MRYCEKCRWSAGKAIDFVVHDELAEHTADEPILFIGACRMNHVF
jgi:hypothetical protein